MAGARGVRVTALSRLALLGGLLILWQLADRAMPPGLFASPQETAQALARMLAEGRLVKALGESLRVYALGGAAAALVGLSLGLAMGLWRPFGRALDIYVNALAATPRVAFIPLIITVLGLGLEAKAMVVFLGAVMPIILNAYAGVLQTDPELLDMARATGAPRHHQIRHILLPGALPFMLTGLRIGATIGLINTVVAEIYTAVSGLGGLLALYGGRFQMAEYFVVVLSLALIGVCITEGLRALEAHLTRWRARG